MKYQAVLWALMPPGRVWTWFGSKLDDLLEAIGENFQDVDDRVVDALAESIPKTAVETIGDWEDQYGISENASLPLAQRQALAQAAHRPLGGVRPADYLALMAEPLGLTAGQLQFIEHPKPQAIEYLHPELVHTGRVYRDPSLPGSYDLSAAQALLDKRTQAHVQLQVIESVLFRCDDPYSLCDRDLLGS